MSGVADLQSGKGHKNENFPVASFLIAPQNRPPVLAFYNFVRAADDVADHASAPAEEKLRLLEQMRASLTGESDAVPEGVRLRAVLNERRLSAVHALDLLEAFRRDCGAQRIGAGAHLLAARAMAGHRQQRLGADLQSYPAASAAAFQG